MSFIFLKKDDILVTRLQNFFAQHQTTDDTTSIDYDYSFDDDNTDQPTQFTLPLIPILDNNDTNLYTVNEPQPSTYQYKIELNDYTFRESNDTENGTHSPSSPSTSHILDEPIAAELKPNDWTNDNSTHLLYHVPNDSWSEQTLLDENGKAQLNPSTLNSDEIDTTTLENVISYDETDVTHSLDATTDSRDLLNVHEESYSFTTSKEMFETEKTISNSSTTVEDYFDTILLNDSLLIGSSKNENTTDFDYDETTIATFSQLLDDESNSGSGENKNSDVDEAITSASTLSTIEDFTIENNNFVYENKIVKSDEQNDKQENEEESNKFFYHHLSTESIIATPRKTPLSVIKFPSSNDEKARGQRVRFPEDSTIRTTSFSWPSDNGYHLMRFWQEQPLINDFKFFSRGNSRAPSGNKY